MKKSWFVRDHCEGRPREVWVFDGLVAQRTGVSNPEHGFGTYFEALPDEDFVSCIRRRTPWLADGVTEGLFHRMELKPGEYYPRIARPHVFDVTGRLWSPEATPENALIAGLRSQLLLLLRRLDRICQTVQPSSASIEVYGHEIRNLLILAATEVESQWRGILKANRTQADSARLNSNEYVKLLSPMRLCDYEVAYANFPDLEPIRPFFGWTSSQPTRSLGWFDAYNGVKHDREAEFHRGTLGQTFKAVSAAVALFIAQFGVSSLNAEILHYVRCATPAWPIPEIYMSGVDQAGWDPIGHPLLQPAA